MIILKHSPSFQISHLYRILYGAAIHKFFQTRGLFHFLDYKLCGTTYYSGGIITMEIDLITKQAKELAKDIQNLKIDTSNTNIGIGYLLLSTEQKIILAAPDGMDAIKKALDDLQQEPWQDIDTLDMIDTRTADTKGGAIIIQKGTPPPTRRLALSLSLKTSADPHLSKLTPLFDHLVHFIHWNSRPGLSMQYGLFNDGIDKPIVENSSFVIPLPFRAHAQTHEILNQRELLEDIVSDFVGFIQKLQDDKAFQRYLKAFHHNTYDTDTLWLMPTPGIVTDTGLLMGTQGWRKIATEENCTLLLENTTVTLTYGHKRISQPIR